MQEESKNTATKISNSNDYWPNYLIKPIHFSKIFLSVTALLLLLVTVGSYLVNHTLYLQHLFGPLLSSYMSWIFPLSVQGFVLSVTILVGSVLLSMVVKYVFLKSASISRFLSWTIKIDHEQSSVTKKNAINQMEATQRENETKHQQLCLLLDQNNHDDHSVYKLNSIKEVHQELGTQTLSVWAREIEYGVYKGTTPFFRLLLTLSDCSCVQLQTTVNLLQIIHRSFGDQAIHMWTKETENKLFNGQTPFYHLLVALELQPKKPEELLKLVQMVHSSFGDQAMSIWVKEIENGYIKGEIPFYWLLNTLYRNPESEEWLKLVKAVHGSLRDQASIVWGGETENKFFYGRTPFYRLLSSLSKNPQLLSLVQTVHDSLGDQAMSIWGKEREDGLLKGETPFYSLLSELDDNPESEELLELVQSVHNRFDSDQAMSMWGKEREGGHYRGVTPFHWLLCALAQNPKSEKLLKMVQAVHDGFNAGQAKIIWGKEREEGEDKGVTPFHWLLGALSQNPKSKKLLKMVQTLHYGFNAGQAKIIWGKEIEEGEGKGATPFCALLGALSGNPKSEKLLEMVQAVHDGFNADQAKIIWGKEIEEGEGKGATPFCALLGALSGNPKSEKLLEMVQAVHDGFNADQAKIIWGKEIEEGEGKGATPFCALLGALSGNPKSKALMNLIQKVHSSFDEEQVKSIWTRDLKGEMAFYDLLDAFENNPQSRCLWTMAQTADACIEGDSERRDLWSKVLKVWARVDAHHRDRLKILLLLNPVGFIDAKDGLVDEHNKEYNECVRSLIRRVLPADDQGCEEQEKVFIDLLSDSLLNINDKNAWHEKHAKIFERFLMGRAIAQCTRDEVNMVNEGVASFENFENDLIRIFLRSILTVENIRDYAEKPKQLHGVLKNGVDSCLKIQSFWREYRTRKLEQTVTPTMRLT